MSLVRKGGVHLRPINITVSTNQFRYDVFTAASSPSDKVLVTVTINTGIRLYGGAFSFLGSLNISSFAAGSVIKVVNNGLCRGAGGAGGDNPPAANGGNGAPGGDAIRINGSGFRVLIDNTNGNVFGGAGGGGGGAGHDNISGPDQRGGGGGGGVGDNIGTTVGGAAGGTTGSGGFAGSIGSTSTAGGGGTATAPAGNGGYGGVDWALTGGIGDDEDPGWGGLSGGAPGVGGYAVRLAGGASAPTWLGGFNPGQVKGAIG